MKLDLSTVVLNEQELTYNSKYNKRKKQLIEQFKQTQPETSTDKIRLIEFLKAFDSKFT